MTARRIGYAVLALTILFALAPLYRGQVEFPTRVHHLLHAVILIGAALSGLLIARPQARSSARGLWLVASVVAPMLAMLLMWPSEYSPLEKLPGAHTAEHLGLVLFGFITAYAGQQYAAGVGVAMSLSMWLMAFLAAWGFGVSPSLQVADTSAAAAPAGANAAASASGDPVRGRTVFAQNCSACHGASARGSSMAPSLIGERSRKNMAQAVQWIENPRPPMPKLYPSPLGERDVLDVAAYVETLK